MGAGEVEACVQGCETGASEGLSNARVADSVLEAERKFGRCEEQGAEPKTHRDANGLRKHPLLNRPTNQEEAGNGQGDASAPDRKQAAKDLLEVEAGVEPITALEERGPTHKLILGDAGHAFGEWGRVQRKRGLAVRLDSGLGLRRGGGLKRRKIDLLGGPDVPGDTGIVLQFSDPALQRVHLLPYPGEPASKHEDQQGFHR